MPADIVGNDFDFDTQMETVILMSDYGVTHHLLIHMATQSSSRAAIISSSQQDMMTAQASLVAYVQAAGKTPPAQLTFAQKVSKYATLGFKTTPVTTQPTTTPATTPAAATTATSTGTASTSTASAS